MSVFKRVKLFFIYILILVVVLQACSPKIVPFNTNNFTDKSFYQLMPTILDKNLKIDSISIFELTFIEKPYEGYYVIDYSEVNLRNNNNILHYKKFNGNYQKLYLLKLITQPKDSIIVYFSLKYNIFDQCIGFGPAYLGQFDENRNSIFFNTELYTRKKKNLFFLKKGSLPLAMYMNIDEIATESYINIEKIIVERSFEIGNNVVIDINRIFRDSSALKFEYTGTRKIN